MKLIRNNVLFVLTVFCISLNVYSGGFPLRAIDEVAEIALKLLTECPPPDCVVLGIGRSPSPITAYIEALGTGRTLSVPLCSVC